MGEATNIRLPIIGVLSRKDVYPTDKRVGGKILHERELLNSAHARFLERAKGSTPLHSQELWGEALDQCSKGWLDSPTPLDCTSERLVLNSEQFNPAFRFPVLQNG